VAALPAKPKCGKAGGRQPEPESAALQRFLKSLVLFPPDDTASSLERWTTALHSDRASAPFNRLSQPVQQLFDWLGAFNVWKVCLDTRLRRLTFPIFHRA
jgi:hypothetical protein